MSNAASRSESEAPGGTVHRLDRGLDDGTLVRRGAGGDEWAKEALYRRHIGLAMQTGLRLLRNRAAAEDAAQDSFLVAFSKLGQLRDPGAFKGWLVRIVVTHVHRQLRRRPVEPLDGLEAEASETASPAVRAELRLLDRVLDGLEPDVRTAWILRYVEGYQLEEVADACDCSLATAKRRIASAHRTVRQTMNVGDYDG